MVSKDQFPENAIAQIKALKGTAQVIGENGAEPAAVDQFLMVGERLNAANASQLTLEFPDGNTLELGGACALVDEELYTEEPEAVAAASVLSDVEQMQADIMAGVDPTETGDPTAAGEEAVVQSEGGQQLNVIGREGNSLIAEAGFDTDGVEPIIPPEDIESTPFDPPPGEEPAPSLIQLSITGTPTIAEGGLASYSLDFNSITLPVGESFRVALDLSDISTDETDYGSFLTAVADAAALRDEINFDPDTSTLEVLGHGGPLDNFEFDLPIQADQIADGDEELRISAEVVEDNTSLGLAQEVGEAPTLITDSDYAATQVQLALTGDTTVNEGGSASYTLDLTDPNRPGPVVLKQGDTITLSLELSDLNAEADDHGALQQAIVDAIASRPDRDSFEFNPETGELTITGQGVAISDLTFSLPITNDDLTEGQEDYRIELGEVTSDDLGVSKGQDQVRTLINDTKTPEAGAESDTFTVSLQGTSTINEGRTDDEGNSVDAEYNLSFTGEPLAEGTTVELRLELTPGGDPNRANADENDYGRFDEAVREAIEGRPELSYNNGILTITGTGEEIPPLSISLGITDDGNPEPAEAYQVTVEDVTPATGGLEPPSVEISNGRVVTTIFDSAVIVSLTAADGSDSNNVNEGSPANYILTFDDAEIADGEIFTVNLGVTDGPADPASTLPATSGSEDYEALATALQNAVSSLGDSRITVNGTVITVEGDGSALPDLPIQIATVNDNSGGGDGVAEGAEYYHLQINSVSPDPDSSIQAFKNDNQDTVQTRIVDSNTEVAPSPENPSPVDTVLVGLSGDENVNEHDGRPSYTLDFSGASLKDQATVRVKLELEFGQESDSASLTDFQGTHVSADALLAQAVMTAIADPNNPDLAQHFRFDPANNELILTGDGESLPPLTFTLPVLDDDLVEGGEDYNVSLSSADTPTSPDAPAVAIENPGVDGKSTVTTTIVDTNAQGTPEVIDISLAGPSQVDEGGDARYELTFDNMLEAGSEVQIQLSFADVDTNNNDFQTDFDAAIQAAVALNPDEFAYNPATDTLTIKGLGTEPSTLPFTLQINQDTDVEGNEPYQINLTPIDNQPINIVGSESVQTVIQDTGATSGSRDAISVGLSGDANVNEGAEAGYTLDFGPEALKSGETISVQLSIDVSGAHTAEVNDFSGGAQQALTDGVSDAIQNLGNRYSFNETTGVLTIEGDGNPIPDLNFNLAIENDSAVEGAENYTVQLASGGGANDLPVNITSPSATTTIADTAGPGTPTQPPSMDAIPVSLTAVDTTADEGDDLVYELSFGDVRLENGVEFRLQLDTANLTAEDQDYIFSNLAVGDNPNYGISYSNGVLTITGRGNELTPLQLRLPTSPDQDYVEEDRETFNLTLSKTGHTNDGLVNIVDDTELSTIVDITPTEGLGVAETSAEVSEAFLAEGTRFGETPVQNEPGLVASGTINLPTSPTGADISITEVTFGEGGDQIRADYNSSTDTYTLDTSHGALEISKASNGSYSYTYTLNNNVDEDDEGIDAESLIENFSIQLRSDNNELGTSTLNVQIADDSPEVDNSDTYDFPLGFNTNLLLVVDNSGSVYGNDNPADSMVAEVKTALMSLLTQYEGYGDVRVQIVGFGGSARTQDHNNDGGLWLDLADAREFINIMDDRSQGGFDSLGQTFYDIATREAISSFDRNGKFIESDAPNAPPVNNVAYFISDGDPTGTTNAQDDYGNNEIDRGLHNGWDPSTLTGSDAQNIVQNEQLNEPFRDNWINFLTENDITAYSVGFNDASNQHLEPVGYDGVAERPIEPALLENIDQLASGSPTVARTVTDSFIDFGADGGEILTLTYNNVTHRVGDSFSDTGPFSAGSSNGFIDIAVPVGVLTINVNTGEYVLLVNEDATLPQTLNLSYTGADHGGTAVNDSLTIQLNGMLEGASSNDLADLSVDPITGMEALSSDVDSPSDTSEVTLQRGTVETISDFDPATDSLNVTGLLDTTRDDLHDQLLSFDGNEFQLNGTTVAIFEGGAPTQPLSLTYDNRGENIASEQFTLDPSSGALTEDVYEVTSGGVDLLLHFDSSQGDVLDLSEILQDDLAQSSLDNLLGNVSVSADQGVVVNGEQVAVFDNEGLALGESVVVRVGDQDSLLNTVQPDVI